MTRTLFGTDGIRGQANTGALTAEMTVRIAMATALHFRRGTHRHTAVIGKDTRLSGYLLEPALTAGLIGMGVDVVLLGPVPTPAVAMLTRSLRADLGIMISASHNPYADNGIKLFAPDGFKLSDEVEQQIEVRLEHDFTSDLAASPELGRAVRLDDAAGRYIEHVKRSFPRETRLDGLKIVVDCAHGAAYKVAPKILWELGAEVIALSVQPNGTNINAQCGATHPQLLSEAVVQHGADIGLALDGDADRLIVVDETGAVIDGDQILALIAESWQRRGILQGGGIVATVMSNLGLERFLQAKGLKLERAAVGDRYVVERMRDGGYTLGGESSGHVVMTDYATTGDGLVAALQVLAEVVEQQKKASVVCRRFEPVPQVVKTVPYPTNVENPLQKKTVQEAIAKAESALKGQGRILVRKSGTESLIRVMVEAESPDNQADITCDTVCAAIRAAIAEPA